MSEVARSIRDGMRDAAAKSARLTGAVLRDQEAHRRETKDAAAIVLVDGECSRLCLQVRELGKAVWSNRPGPSSVEGEAAFDRKLLETLDARLQLVQNEIDKLRQDTADQLRLLEAKEVSGASANA